MFRKDRKNGGRILRVDELEKELKRVYDRTAPAVVRQYIDKDSVDAPASRTHNITGCSDCPFVRSSSNGEGFIHTFCIWDGTKSDIKQFVAADAVTPGQCPLRSSDIQVTINN